MSGGYFQYDQDRIGRIAETVQTLIENNDSDEKDRWGERLGSDFPPEIIARFREAVAALRRAEVYAQRIDWLMSGDDGEGSFLQRLDEELRAIEVQS